MSDDQAERAPLLGDQRDVVAETNSGGAPADVLQRSFVLATTASLVTGSLTVMFFVVSAIVISHGPEDYWPPYVPDYDLAFMTGCVVRFFLSPPTPLTTVSNTLQYIIATGHSASTLIRFKAGNLPASGFAGILVDVIAGLYCFFQGLYGMQIFLQRDNYGCHVPRRGSPTSPGSCDAWRKRAEPVFWIYLLSLFAFG